MPSRASPKSIPILQPDRKIGKRQASRAAKLHLYACREVAACVKKLQGCGADVSLGITKKKSIPITLIRSGFPNADLKKSARITGRAIDTFRGLHSDIIRLDPAGGDRLHELSNILTALDMKVGTEKLARNAKART
jgi:hypothetical protein